MHYMICSISYGDCDWSKMKTYDCKKSVIVLTHEICGNYWASVD